MKLIVDKMPVTANECLFSAMGTGKPRCRHDAKLCPLLRGEECPYLMEISSLKLIEFARGALYKTATGAVPDVENLAGYNTQMSVIDEPAPEPKNRTTKRSMAKKAD